MPLLLLDALGLLQSAIALGLVCYTYAGSIPVREWLQLPMMQRQLRKYSARRLRFTVIYGRIALAISAVMVVAALALAGIAYYEAVTTPNPRLATLADVIDAMPLLLFLASLQVGMLAMLFMRVWRTRRGLRAMAREELALSRATSAADEASAPVGS